MPDLAVYDAHRDGRFELVYARQNGIICHHAGALIVALALAGCKSTMPRPKLPLETQANIEIAREVFFATQPLEKLFSLITPMFGAGGSLTPPRPQTARVKLAFQQYACGLFDCEAQFYARHTRHDGELLLWLTELLACIVDDVNAAVDLHSRQTFLSFDFHCTSSDRMNAMWDALEERSEYWVKVARANPEVCAIWERALAADPTLRAIWELSQPPKPISSSTSQNTSLPIASPKIQAGLDELRHIDRKALRDSYLAMFPENIKILDICWAAQQRYREWKRWIANESKDGSTADRAFRAILTSGKTPSVYRSVIRPPKWQ